MSNNKTLFMEQQKIAIKISRAQEMSYSEFIEFHKQFRPAGAKWHGVLPLPESIYKKLKPSKATESADRFLKDSTSAGGGLTSMGELADEMNEENGRGRQKDEKEGE